MVQERWVMHQSKWNHTSGCTAGKKKKKTTLRIIINLEKPMGNEALTNQRHLLRMLVEQRITIEGGIQTVIELRGKKGMWQYIM